MITDYFSIGFPNPDIFGLNLYYLYAALPLKGTIAEIKQDLNGSLAQKWNSDLTEFFRKVASEISIPRDKICLINQDPTIDPDPEHCSMVRLLSFSGLN
jgi:hypothetical protein